jgi:type IV secretory pathway VirB4 component
MSIIYLLYIPIIKGFCSYEGFLYFVNEGFLYFVDEGFLYFIDEGFLYFVKMVVLTNHMV